MSNVVCVHVVCVVLRISILRITLIYADPTLALTVLPSTTRLPNVSPYNTFTLTCTATAPMGVVEPKTFTWRRTTASGGSCGSFGMVIESGTCQIANSNVNQPVSTSVLTVTLTIAAVWRYCCQASLLGVTGTSDGVAVTVTGECLTHTEPTQQVCVFCSASTVTYHFLLSKQHTLSWFDVA